MSPVESRTGTVSARPLAACQLGLNSICSRPDAHKHSIRTRLIPSESTKNGC
jgi:hypothetical protein